MGLGVKKLRFIWNQICFLGGSTGNERLLPEELTIVGKINSNFKNNNFKKTHIYNASVDGKSLRGHINDFEFWFQSSKIFNQSIL